MTGRGVLVLVVCAAVEAEVGAVSDEERGSRPPALGP